MYRATSGTMTGPATAWVRAIGRRAMGWLVTSAVVGLTIASVPTAKAGSKQQRSARASHTSCPPGRVNCANRSGPTYEETSKWVVRTLSEVSGGDWLNDRYIIGETYSDFKMDGCVLHWVDNTKETNRKTYKVFSRAIVYDLRLADLGDIDLSTISHPGNRVKIIAIDFKGAKGRLGSLLVGNDPDNYAPRLQTALTHAAALCQPNEPF